MWVNSSLLNRGFCTAVRISAAAQKKTRLESDTIQILSKCPPRVYLRQSVSHSLPENVQRQRKIQASVRLEVNISSDYRHYLWTNWTLLGIWCLTTVFPKLSQPQPPSLSGVRLVMLVCRGLRVQAGEVTSNCYLTCRRMAANLRINLRCVHVCVRMSKNLLQPVPASENREVYVTIRVRYMPLWLLLLTVSSWEHAGPPPADLEACQARLWCRSVSGGQARSSPRKENDTSKQEPPVLFPVESSSSLAAVTPSRLNAKWTGRRTGCRL